jgi:hypothetical protein
LGKHRSTRLGGVTQAISSFEDTGGSLVRSNFALK